MVQVRDDGGLAHSDDDGDGEMCTASREAFRR